MNAVKVDNARSACKKMTKKNVLKAIARSRLRFTSSWDELRRDTRES